MRTTVVPAQVTTVEDRIMGNLGFSQLILLVLPIFIAAGLFAGLPPFMNGSLFKYIVITIIYSLSAILAIRIKGKIVLMWLVTIIRYNLRPKYYLFTKSTDTYRRDYAPIKKAEKKPEPATRKDKPLLPRLTTEDMASTLALATKESINLRFEMNRRGGLNVRFTEINE